MYFLKLPQSSYYRLVMNGDQLDQGCLKTSAEKELKKIIERFDLPDDRMQTHICIGTPRDAILQIADEINADLIVIGSHNPEDDSYHIGSTAADITRLCKTFCYGGEVVGGTINLIGLDAINKNIYRI
ncbi:universal stress protein [Shigella sp. FC1967]|uniref:universal stress protein n=1 Tax=Shigella sp. FC1967 TaxID=1898041 RepID=UPI000A77155D|nr:universal stress protein [Shigella sp. FC1967]